MDRPQMYDPSLGFQGNLEEALWGNQYRKNEIENNKSTQDMINVTNEEVMCELDPIDRLAEIEEALIELEALITEAKNE